MPFSLTSLTFALAFLSVQADEPIVTDRPDFTESSIVVPLRRLQLETGLTQTWASGTRSFGAPEALFRYGVAKNWELRIGLPNWSLFSDTTGSRRGFSDLYLGAKVQLGPTPSGMDMALIIASFLPTGSRDFGSGGIDPELKFCVSRDLSEKSSLAGMIYTAWPTENGERKELLQTTLSYGHSLTEALGVFLEYAGTFEKRVSPDHIAHAGFAYRTNPDTQWDLHFGTSLAGERRTFVGAGYSVRF